MRYTRPGSDADGLVIEVTWFFSGEDPGDENDYAERHPMTVDKAWQRWRRRVQGVILEGYERGARHIILVPSYSESSQH